jgi:RAB protein geranylgeranyltransferase component A
MIIKLNGLLKEGEISIFKKNKIEKINFIFNITENNFNFKDISFDTNNINFLSDRLDIKKDRKNYLLEGSFKNKDSILNDQYFK